MINNKAITIIKDNQFDKGWTLFSSSSLNVNANPYYQQPLTSDLVKAITYSDVVTLMLSDICLPSNLVKELCWVKGYSKTEIHIIAKKQDIVNFYDNIKFDSIKIDESLDYNYIDIRGRYNGSYFIDDSIIETNDLFRDYYFKNKNKPDYSFLKDTEQLIVICSKRYEDSKFLIDIAKSNKTTIKYIIDVKCFDRAASDYFKSNNIKLYVSPLTVDSIIVVGKDGAISKLSFIKDKIPILMPIEKITSYTGELYECLFLKEKLNGSEIPQNVYTCFNGVIEKLDIKERHIVFKEIHIPEMEDFLNEKFDRSFTNNHNDYSNKAKVTEYSITLVPPLIDQTYKWSSLYHGVCSLIEEWNLFQKKELAPASAFYHQFMQESCSFISLIDQSQARTNKFDGMFSKCSFKGYYQFVDTLLNEYSDAQNKLLDDCALMFNSVNQEVSDTRFDKFDIEIEGYRKTIKEKETQILNNIDVLSNKRRIEILQSKIDNLIAMKAKFENNDSSRKEKEASDFVNYCKKIIEGAATNNTDSDSITKIVGHDTSRKAKLNSFVNTYLAIISSYIDNCIECLKKLKKEHIVEDYIVYEKDNQRYIIIENESEYEITKGIREEFSLKCLVWRRQ